MKIKVLYENDIKKGYAYYTTIEVPDDDYTVLIDIDYKQRLSEAKPEKRSEVKKFETLQDVFDEMNKKEFNANRRFFDHNIQAKCVDNYDPLENITDYSQEVERNQKNEYEIVCKYLRDNLKDRDADLIIAVVLDGKSIKEYAQEMGLSEAAEYKRYGRAIKKIKLFYEKCPKTGSLRAI